MSCSDFQTIFASGGSFFQRDLTPGYKRLLSGQCGYLLFAPVSASEAPLGTLGFPICKPQCHENMEDLVLGPGPRVWPWASRSSSLGLSTCQVAGLRLAHSSPRAVAGIR